MGTCTSSTRNSDVQMTATDDQEAMVARRVAEQLNRREHNIEIIVAQRVEQAEARLRHQFQMEIKTLSELLLVKQRMYEDSEKNAKQMRQEIYQLKHDADELSAINNYLVMENKKLKKALNESINTISQQQMKDGSTHTVQPADEHESEKKKIKCGVVVRVFV